MTTNLLTMRVCNLFSLNLQHISTSLPLFTLHTEMSFYRNCLSMFPSMEEILQRLIQRINNKKHFVETAKLPSNAQPKLLPIEKEYLFPPLSTTGLVGHGLPDPSEELDCVTVKSQEHLSITSQRVETCSISPEFQVLVPITSFFFFFPLSRFSMQSMLSRHGVTMNSAFRSTRESIYSDFVI